MSENANRCPLCFGSQRPALIEEAEERNEGSLAPGCANAEPSVGVKVGFVPECPAHGAAAPMLKSPAVLPTPRDSPTP